MVKRLLEDVELLHQRVAALEAENEHLKQQLNKSANSGNSSQPPSRDQKPNQPANQPKKKRGAPFGHQKYSRPLVEDPDRVIHARVSECDNCLADLSKVTPEDFERRQIIELPEVKPVVIETRQHRIICPHCLKPNRGQLPEGLEANRYFGPKLEAPVVFYKQIQHLSYERLVETMRNLHGVELSEGAIAQILQRAGEKAHPVAEEIRAEVIKGSVIKSDETSARVKARNWWQWVFISDAGVSHTMVPTRSKAEIKTVMGSLCVEVWVCDCLGSQLSAPAKVFQLCLAHQIRDLQRVIEKHPPEEWATTLQGLFRDAIHLRNRFEEMTLAGFQRRVTEIENQLDCLLEQTVESQEARRLQNRYRTHREKLLTFLSYPEVPPTNNESEQALRGSVVHRKVTNGFRSEWGAKAYAALQTIIATAKHRGEDTFQALVNLIGAPVLPFLNSSSP